MEGEAGFQLLRPGSRNRLIRWFLLRTLQAIATLLAALVVADFGVLGFFKYAGFLADNLNAILPGRPIPEAHHALPLGISFFTFQLVSYVVDVHRGAVKVERDPARFAAYILMFPHLIAGPIVRFAPASSTPNTAGLPPVGTLRTLRKPASVASCAI
jgi:Predicted membrane protein involved in D-alanine export